MTFLAETAELMRMTAIWFGGHCRPTVDKWERDLSEVSAGVDYQREDWLKKFSWSSVAWA